MTARTLPSARPGALLLLAATTALSLPALAQTPATSGWGTYVGGSAGDRASGIANTAAGDLVTVGSTTSQDLVPGGATEALTATEAFVIRLDAEGSILSRRTFGGADTEDVATAVAFGPQGHIYVVGYTRSSTVSNAGTVMSSYQGAEDAFLAHFNPDGTPDWFMYLGGTGNERALGVAVSGTAVYVAGYTDSVNLAGTPGAINGGTDGFVMKVDTSAASPAIAWSRILGGSGADMLSGVAVNGAGDRLLAVGTAASAVSSLSALNGFQGGASDALVLTLSPADGSVAWARYVGTSGADEGRAVAPGSSGEVLVAGTSGLISGSGKNAFAAWLTSAGAERQTRTWGGNGDEEVSSATVDSYGTLYVGGTTHSADFPVLKAFDSTFESGAAGQEGFVTVLPASGGPGWASFVGGDGVDDVKALTVWGVRLFLAGETASSSGLPTSSFSDDSTLSGPTDGFIVSATIADPTPPTIGDVYDRPQQDDVHDDVDEQLSLTSISANWTGFFETSGPVTFEWAIGTASEPELVQPFTAVAGSATSATATGLLLTAGTTYVVSVRAINFSGLSNAARSDGVRVLGSGTDGGTGGTDGGINNGTDGGINNGTDGGTNGGPGDEQPEGGCSCAATDAGLPMLLGFAVLLMLVRRRAASPP